MYHHRVGFSLHTLKITMRKKFEILVYHHYNLFFNILIFDVGDIIKWIDRKKSFIYKMFNAQSLTTSSIGKQLFEILFNHRYYLFFNIMIFYASEIVKRVNREKIFINNMLNVQSLTRFSNRCTI